MENKSKKTNNKFHAVDFMRKVRNELSEDFLQDKKKYFDYLKTVMDDFKMRQRNYHR